MDEEYALSSNEESVLQQQRLSSRNNDDLSGNDEEEVLHRLWRDQPSWIAALGDVDPFASQMPTLFPYELPTGLSIQGRRMSGSTIVTTTTAATRTTEPVKNLFGKKRSSPQLQILLDRLYENCLDKPRPFLHKQHRVYATTTTNASASTSEEDTRQLSQLEVELRELEERWMDPQFTLDNAFRTKSEFEMAWTNQKIADLAMTMGLFPRAAKALQDRLRILQSIHYRGSSAVIRDDSVLAPEIRKCSQ
ncbi:expressed unknown protein [Seminavis robusta]|uniref:Uncharacterized protein n=1 Tax=Seminavis robusta TaxID=568900 RepID=A0A9N8HGZ6_9STRA|nr:expressed unknown protein [Seminavis robusta]|eukprot:Sro605_g174340.1 n/a (249) ;mRNA; r:36368-37114